MCAGWRSIFVICTTARRGARPWLAACRSLGAAVETPPGWRVPAEHRRVSTAANRRGILRRDQRVSPGCAGSARLAVLFHMLVTIPSHLVSTPSCLPVGLPTPRGTRAHSDSGGSVSVGQGRRLRIRSCTRYDSRVTWTSRAKRLVPNHKALPMKRTRYTHDALPLILLSSPSRHSASANSHASAMT